MRKLLILPALVMLATPASAQRGPDAAKPRVIAVAQSVDQLLLVKATEGHAVIRFGNAPLQTIRVGDLVGTTKAVVKEIAAGRLALDETFTGKDGKPNRALIIIKEGERGGTRYLQRPEKPQM